MLQNRKHSLFVNYFYKLTSRTDIRLLSKLSLYYKTKHNCWVQIITHTDKPAAAIIGPCSSQVSIDNLLSQEFNTSCTIYHWSIYKDSESSYICLGLSIACLCLWNDQWSRSWWTEYDDGQIYSCFSPALMSNFG